MQLPCWAGATDHEQWPAATVARVVAAVESVVSGNTFQSSDVIRLRQGLTIEIHNTDAKGRLILCDALAQKQSPNSQS